MRKKDNLDNARKAKKDEFYTQYEDIEKEVSVYYEYNHDVFKDKVILCPCDNPERSNFTKYFVDNFDKFGIKKLISTCYIPVTSSVDNPLQCTFEQTPQTIHGKFMVKDCQQTVKGDLHGTGDFRSDEIKHFRDEADIIITNPPFSLFREFVNWIFEANKEFLILGNLNACTYHNIFPKIQNRQMTLGTSIRCGDVKFEIPNEYKNTALLQSNKEDKQFCRFSQIRWFTNLPHPKRVKKLSLMTMEDNLKYSKHSLIRENGYVKYDNFDAIEVPFTDAIPVDYNGMMGVPITFLDYWDSEVFEIVKFRKGNDDKDLRIRSNNVNVERERERELYARIVVRRITRT